MKTLTHYPLTALLGALALGAACEAARAVDYHAATKQDLQTYLTLAAASSGSNNIYVTNGYYLGNFNYNSTNVNNLTLMAEPGVANTQITIDSGGTGSSMNIIGTATANITVQGMTFLRNCGSTTIGGLQIAGGNTTILVNGCQFLSPTNSSGIGLYITAGLRATVTNCIVAGSPSGGGGLGIDIPGVPIVAVQGCSITTNSGKGLFLKGNPIVSVTITDSLFAGNKDVSGNAGGGAMCSSPSMTNITLSGNTFVGNYAQSAGGAYCWGTAVILSGNLFAGNTAPGTRAGGADCEGTTITLSANIFTGNSTGGTSDGYADPTGGGGVLCNGTAVTLVGNTFNSNSTIGGGGGGAYCSGATTLYNNTFTNNSSGNIGGGVYCSGTMTLSANTLQHNTAISGGGLYASGPTINLLDNLIVGNTVTATNSQGGGVWVDASATLNMINNTVTGNTSPGTGGGVAYIVTGTVELLNVYNNLIWGNLATVSGGDVYLSGTGKQKVFSFNDADSYYGVWDIALHDIDVAPQFFDPVNGDYHLQSTSACLNAGTSSAPSLPLTDLDGSSRTNSAGLVDMGCYEFNTAATHPADTNGAFVLTAAEFNAYAAAWKNGQAWSNAPSVIPANYLTRAGYLSMTNGGAYINDGSARPTNWKP